MSAAAGLPAAADDLVLDPGVLADLPTIEFNGLSAAARTSGAAVLPWRAHAREAAALALAHQPTAAGLSGFAQAVVRVGKGRAATAADLSAAWGALAEGGRLLLAGTNDVGIATWAKRLAKDLGQAATVLANRAHGRVVAFTRTADAGALPTPVATTVALPDGTALHVAPGVFSGDGLDGGTALLLTVLAEEPPAALVVDVGCGAGHLGLAAARRWPAARVHLLDADHRAVTSATGNAAALGAGNAVATWWDEHDPWPAPDADLALLNPPCHAGTATDLGAARRLFAVVRASRLLVVANRQLPYEAELRMLGMLRPRADDGRFKVLEVTR